MAARRVRDPGETLREKAVLLSGTNLPGVLRLAAEFGYTLHMEHDRSAAGDRAGLIPPQQLFAGRRFSAIALEPPGREPGTLRVRAPVRLLQSAQAVVPMAIGWLRPVILLPAAALTGR